jgi:ABC-2 type transport system permease protein
MRHVLRVWGSLLRNCIIREMMFRANFLAILLTTSWWFILNIMMFQVIFGHVDAIAGWTKYEVFFLVGAGNTIMGLFETLFIMNLMRLPDMIRTGELDFHLLKPVNTQFLVSARYADFEAVPNTMLGFVFMGWCAYKLHAAMTLPSLMTFMLFVFTGVALYYSIMFISVTVSFWFLRFQAMNVWWQLTTLGRQPAEIFPPKLKFILTYCLPMLVIVNFPVKALLGKLPLFAGIWGLVITVVLVSFSGWFFRFALRRYRSASS